MLYLERLQQLIYAIIAQQCVIMISVLENILEGSQQWKSAVMLEQLPSKYGVQNVARKGWKQRFCRNNMYLICSLTTWGLNKANGHVMSQLRMVSASMVGHTMLP